MSALCLWRVFAVGYSSAVIDPDLGYWIGDCSDFLGLTHLAIEADRLAKSRLEDRAWVAGAKKAPKWMTKEE